LGGVAVDIVAKIYRHSNERTGMKYINVTVTIGLIILLVCIVGCTSTAPPTSQKTLTPSPQPTPTGSCLEVVSGKYVSVKGSSWNVAGTPDNYATFEVNGNTGKVTFLQSGAVVTISLYLVQDCKYGQYKWTGKPYGSGDLGIVGENPDKVSIYGFGSYEDHLDFVKF
jgi:hypothetical protein